jgi:hypothetical protein
MVKINVNAIDKHVEAENLSYEDVVVLAGDDPSRILSVTYSHRASGKQGLLYKGKSVTVMDGMSFGVFDTSNA